MVSMSVLLLITLFLPIAGVALVWALQPSGRAAVRVAALVTTLLTMCSAGYLAYHFPADAEVFAQTDLAWLGESSIDIRFSVGLDGASLWMFALSTLLMITAVLVSWQAIEERPAEFYSLLLLLEMGMLGVFVARDIILFYVFFEFTLIPLFFLIGVWGSEQRRYAATKFFLFTLAGSVLTFLGLLAIVLRHYQLDGELTFSIQTLTANLQDGGIGETMQIAIFLALFIGFAIKVPLFPLHTWLPLAHVQAPTAGSVILAGVLLKIGTYGFIRFSMPLLPYATAVLMPWLLWLSVSGIIYGALVALAQKDIKRLIAYSSVSHLGFCTLGLFTLNRLGVQGGVLQMVNHGLATGGLFAIVGMVYERYHTRQISELGGLAHRTPLLTVMMVLFTFSSIGLPGMNGFSGEFLILQGMFQRGWTGTFDPSLAWQFKFISVLAVAGVVLGAWYMLWLVQRVFFGPLKEPHQHDDQPIRDLSMREAGALLPLLVFVFWIGVQPQFFIERMDGTLNELTRPARREFADRYDQTTDVAQKKTIPETKTEIVNMTRVDRPVVSLTDAAPIADKNRERTDAD